MGSVVLRVTYELPGVATGLPVAIGAVQIYETDVSLYLDSSRSA